MFNKCGFQKEELKKECLYFTRVQIWPCVNQKNYKKYF